MTCQFTQSEATKVSNHKVLKSVGSNVVIMGTVLIQTACPQIGKKNPAEEVLQVMKSMEQLHYKENI